MDVWAAEKPSLMPLPTAFDGYVEQSKRVSRTCLITFDRNRYSVPASFANRPVSLHIYPERLVVMLEACLWHDAEGHVVCVHQRIIERSHRQPGRVIYDWRHYLAVVQRKPLRRGKQSPGLLSSRSSPFATVPLLSRCRRHSASCRIRCCASPAAIASLSGHFFQKCPAGQWMVEILSLVLHHVMPEACFQHDEQAVLCAVEMALEASVPTKTHVLNLLHRLVDGTPTDQPDVTPPSSLVLKKEPEANVARYDGLRTSGGKRHAS